MNELHASISRVFSVLGTAACLLLAGLMGDRTLAQSASVPEAPPVANVAAKPAMPGPEAFADLAWLEGCWRGNAAEREFNEHWLPPRGNLMIGASHTIYQGRTQGYEYLRLEPRSDGVYYVAVPSGQKETAFRLVDRTNDTAAGRNDEVFTFANPAEEFPQQIIYRKASEGWLYATVEGKVAGAPRQVVYPMRRIGCESGELLKR